MGRITEWLLQIQAEIGDHYLRVEDVWRIREIARVVAKGSVDRFSPSLSKSICTAWALDVWFGIRVPSVEIVDIYLGSTGLVPEALVLEIEMGLVVDYWYMFVPARAQIQAFRFRNLIRKWIALEHVADSWTIRDLIYDLGVVIQVACHMSDHFDLSPRGHEERRPIVPRWFWYPSPGLPRGLREKIDLACWILTFKWHHDMDLGDHFKAWIGLLGYHPKNVFYLENRFFGLLLESNYQFPRELHTMLERSRERTGHPEMLKDIRQRCGDNKDKREDSSLPDGQLLDSRPILAVRGLDPPESESLEDCSLARECTLTFGAQIGQSILRQTVSAT